jgi:hypothetical protein
MLRAFGDVQTELRKGRFAKRIVRNDSAISQWRYVDDPGELSAKERASTPEERMEMPTRNKRTWRNLRGVGMNGTGMIMVAVVVVAVRTRLKIAWLRYVAHCAALVSYIEWGGSK